MNIINSHTYLNLMYAACMQNHKNKNLWNKPSYIFECKSAFIDLGRQTGKTTAALSFLEANETAIMVVHCSEMITLLKLENNPRVFAVSTFNSFARQDALDWVEYVIFDEIGYSVFKTEDLHNLVCKLPNIEQVIFTGKT